MKLHNTLTRTTEEFKPIAEGQVKFYSCGPTVYDNAHIGNLRNFVFYDTLRRALTANGYKVSHVMNITDVGHLTSDADEGDDKLEKGAKREGKSVWDIAKHFTDQFMADALKMNILPPNGYKGKTDNYARATDFIDQQIEIIKTLLDKGFAYPTQQAIYFDVTKLPSYGKLTGQKLNDKEVAARDDVVTDENKQNPHDFALWFFTVGHFKGHSMHWNSPWGDGFPGWHLECSAIIHATLGDPIDIHAGGVDLIGTHHTNEMAQTEAAFGNQLANYWIHSEHLHIDGKKISKSLGNYITLNQVIEKGFDPMALRLLFLQAHYKSQLNFTWHSLEDTQKVYDKFSQWSDLQFQEFKSEKLKEEFEADKNLIIDYLADDLNTAKALAVFNSMLDKTDEIGPDSQAVKSVLEFFDDVLGITPKVSQDVSPSQSQILIARHKAREAGNWQESDNLRDQLAKEKIGVKDTKFGQIWYRI